MLPGADTPHDEHRQPRRSVLVLGLIAIALLASRSSADPREDWQTRVDSVAGLHGNATITEVVKTKPKAYLSACFATYPISFQTALRGYILYQDSLSNMLGTIKRWERVHGAGDPGSTYYFESGVGIAHAWCLLDKISVLTDSSTHLIARYERNRDPHLNAMWQRQCRGWLRIGYQGYEIRWQFLKVDEMRTRVGVTMRAESDAHVPRWLHNVVVDYYLPRLLDDLADGIADRMPVVRQRLGSMED